MARARAIGAVALQLMCFATALGAWVPLGSTNLNAAATVLSLAVNGSTLYVGGTFNTAGGVSSPNVAAWNGSAWAAVGGVSAAVNALAVWGSDLYAGGLFTLPSNRIARFSSTSRSWFALGSGMNAGVTAIAIDPVARLVYAGGGFTTAGGISSVGIAKWDGTAWSAVGGSVTGSLNGLAFNATGYLYLAGFFANAGGQYVTRWDGTAYINIGGGVAGGIRDDTYCITYDPSGGTVYAGGYFEPGSSPPFNRIASYNGTAWAPMGSGMDTQVYSIAVAPGADWGRRLLVAGGAFTTAGGTPAAHVAAWNGSSWSAMGAGTTSTVQALAYAHGGFYAGGAYATMDGRTVNGIGFWALPPPSPSPSASPSASGTATTSSTSTPSTSLSSSASVSFTASPSGSATLSATASTSPIATRTSSPSPSASSSGTLSPSRSTTTSPTVTLSASVSSTTSVTSSSSPTASSSATTSQSSSAAPAGDAPGDGRAAADRNTTPGEVAGATIGTIVLLACLIIFLVCCCWPPAWLRKSRRTCAASIEPHTRFCCCCCPCCFAAAGRRRKRLSGASRALNLTPATLKAARRSRSSAAAATATATVEDWDGVAEPVMSPPLPPPAVTATASVRAVRNPLSFRLSPTTVVAMADGRRTETLELPPRLTTELAPIPVLA